MRRVTTFEAVRLRDGLGQISVDGNPVLFHAVDLDVFRSVAVLADPRAPESADARVRAVEELGRAGFPVVVTIVEDAPGAAMISIFAAPGDEEACAEAACATWAVKALGGGDESSPCVFIPHYTGIRFPWMTVQPTWRRDATWSVATWPPWRGAWRALLEELPRHAGAALLLLDVDRIKAYNDTYGLPNGELALARIYACVEAAALEHTSAVIRVAGDELAVLVDGLDALDRAAQLAERVRRNVEALDIRLLNPRVTTTRLTVSIGVVPVRNVATVAQEAENAVYEAKRRGRNRVWRADD